MLKNPYEDEESLETILKEKENDKKTFNNKKQKYIIYFIWIVIALAIVYFFAQWGYNFYSSFNKEIDEATKPTEIKLRDIKINAAKTEISVGEELELSVTYTPEKATNRSHLKWTSGNTSVIEVNNGVVTGLSKGESIITATDVNTNIKGIIVIYVK